MSVSDGQRQGTGYAYDAVEPVRGERTAARGRRVVVIESRDRSAVARSGQASLRRWTIRRRRTNA